MLKSLLMVSIYLRHPMRPHPSPLPQEREPEAPSPRGERVGGRGQVTRCVKYINALLITVKVLAFATLLSYLSGAIAFASRDIIYFSSKAFSEVLRPSIFCSYHFMRGVALIPCSTTDSTIVMNVIQAINSPILPLSPCPKA